jgi:hypothetical protein
MKRLVNTLHTFILSTILLTGCSKDILKGEGDIVMESRQVSDFTMVEISGNRFAEIIPSAESKVEITGYENLIPAFESRVINGKLYFDFPNHYNVRRDNIKLKIFTPVVGKLRLSGQTEVTITDGFNGQVFEAQLSGNGKLTTGTGNFETIGIFTSGNSRVYARNLTGNKVQVDVSGNGYIEVKAKAQLAVNISGNGEVHYWGTPAITTKISGNGKAIKH